MHRLGFDERGFAVAWQRLADLSHVHKRLRLMTHLACADDRDNPMTARQIEAFTRQLRDVPAERSIANSAGLIGWPEARAPTGCAPGSCCTASRRSPARRAPTWV